MAAHHVLDDYYLAITLLVTVGYQLLGFSIAFTCQFDKLTGKPTLHYNIRRVSLGLSFPLFPCVYFKSTQRIFLWKYMLKRQ